jgi:hypothetical protein
LVFDISSCLVKFFLPLLENTLSLLDDFDGIIRLFLEDFGDVNLGLNLVTDLVGDALKDVLHLVLVLVDVSRNSPDKLQTSQ